MSKNFFSENMRPGEGLLSYTQEPPRRSLITKPTQALKNTSLSSDFFGVEVGVDKGLVAFIVKSSLLSLPASIITLSQAGDTAQERAGIRKEVRGPRITFHGKEQHSQ